MTKRYLLRGAVIGFLTLAALNTGDAATPYSRTMPAIGGHAWQFADSGCFTSSWSAVQNTGCSGARKFLIPVHFRTKSISTLSLSAAAASGPAQSAKPSCRGVLNDPGNGLLAQTALVSIASGPAYTSVGSLPVASTAEAHFDCDLTSQQSSGLGLTALKWAEQ
jgi:hypothetical protein